MERETRVEEDTGRSATLGGAARRRWLQQPRRLGFRPPCASRRAGQRRCVRGSCSQGPSPAPRQAGPADIRPTRACAACRESRGVAPTAANRSARRGGRARVHRRSDRAAFSSKRMLPIARFSDAIFVPMSPPSVGRYPPNRRILPAVPRATMRAVAIRDKTQAKGEWRGKFQ